MGQGQWCNHFIGRRYVDYSSGNTTHGKAEKVHYNINNKYKLFILEQIVISD